MLGIAAAFAAAPAATAEKPTEIVIEKVFGPEIPGKYKHPASITQLANGDLLIAYFGGSGEYEPDTRVHLTWKRKGEDKWSLPTVVSENPEVPEGNPVVWQAPDGLLWLFNVARFGPTWCDSRVQARTSADGGKTWTKPYLISDEIGILCRSKPIVLADGDYLLPVYKETGNDPEFTAADTSSFFYRYHPESKKWTETSRIRSKLGNLQPAPVAMTEDHLIAYCRRGGGYEGKEDGRIVRSESRDGGKTWSPGTETEFPNPNAAVDFQRLKNGNLLLVYNDSNFDRTPLTLALSTDGDRSYPHRRDIGVGDHDYAYPYLIQTDDGKIHLIYTQDGRSTIMHAVFDDTAVIGHKK
jgi:predicted neuraminidase